MAEQPFNYDVLAVLLNATSVKVIERVKEQKNGTISDTDPAGAMKFTIAVVLVYGVGVIGLLGISARRNRRVELMDKEVNKYIKSLHRDKPVRRKTKPKRTIYRLISSLHARSKACPGDSRLQSNRPDKFLQKSFSWTAGVSCNSSRKSSTRSTGSSSRAARTVLQQIAENRSEEAVALNEPSPHILASSSPALHLDLSSIPQSHLQETEAPDVSSTSANVKDDVMQIKIVTPRQERQETVVNLSSPQDDDNTVDRDGSLDRDQSDDTTPYNTGNTSHLATGSRDLDAPNTSANQCTQIVVVPNEELTKGHPKRAVL